MATEITAGDASAGASISADTSGALTLRVGAAGSKVNGLALDASGNAAFAGTLTQAGVSTPRIQLNAAQATTSGTSIDLPAVPSWVKRITIPLNGVSTNGTSNWAVRIGSGSIDTSGYTGAVTTSGGGSVAASSGFLLPLSSATVSLGGSLTLTNVSGNIWSCSITAARTDGAAETLSGGGNKTLTGALTNVRLTTVGGTDTFDAGSISSIYEG